MGRIKTPYNSHFLDQCIEDLQKLQDELKQKYKIDWYKNWFYNESTGLFTLSTGEKEVNFRYLNIGTFSRNTNTWKWSWDKEDTDQKTKRLFENVRGYGEQNNFENLKTGYFEAEETDGWEFAAISARLLGGIGVYRAVDVHLLIFILLTEPVSNDEAKKIKEAFVSCGEHGDLRRAFICRHLEKNVKT